MCDVEREYVRVGWLKKDFICGCVGERRVVKVMGIYFNLKIATEERHFVANLTLFRI